MQEFKIGFLSVSQNFQRSNYKYQNRDKEFSGNLFVVLTSIIDIVILWTAFRLISLEVYLVFPLR